MESIRADRLRKAKWGIFTHYLGGKNGTMDAFRSKGQPLLPWDQTVGCFDVERYAKMAHEIGAGYVFFTVMQGFQYLCAPNETYERISGLPRGEATTHRDLPYELGKALEKYGIDLYLYYTGDGPYASPKVGEKFGYVDRSKGVTADFVNQWVSVLREYAVRYGDLVKGWWIDGCYDYINYTDELLKPYKDAVLAGNPNAVIAFNGGVERVDYMNPKYDALCGGETNPMKRIARLYQLMENGDAAGVAAYAEAPSSNQIKWSVHDDYIAGEANKFEEYPPIDGMVDGAPWHKLSFLGIPTSGVAAWASPGSKYSAKYMREYIEKCSARGGAVSVDVCTFRDGSIDCGQYEVLRAMGYGKKA